MMYKITRGDEIIGRGYASYAVAYAVRRRLLATPRYHGSRLTIGLERGYNWTEHCQRREEISK